MKSKFKYISFILSLLVFSSNLNAEPWLPAGDSLLRHDVTVLADAGVILVPITTWPLSVASIDSNLKNFSGFDSLSNNERVSLSRLQARISDEKVTYRLQREVSGSASRELPVIRSYQNTARTDLGFGASITQLSNRFAFKLDAQLIDNAEDGKNVRFDGSYLAGIFKNTIVSAGYIDKYWGPGWQGSLIYSNNARPIPGVSFQRNFVTAFESKWFRWMGPWTYMITAGRLERNRTIPNPFHLGMRFSFKPLSSLEIGVSRTAQWGGEGRPQTSDSFLDLLLGQDNVGSGGLNSDNEPGNQLAGFDVRWHQGVLPFDLTLYTQAIGEDEAGGFPSRYLGQFGLEHTRTVFDRNLRVWLEYADTACDFLESSPKLNCAYTHSIYNNGYRYLGESIGHPIDGDSRALTLAALLSDSSNVDWQIQLHKFDINRAPDTFHSISTVPVNGFQFDLARTSNMPWGKVRVNIGYQDFDAPLDNVSGFLLGLEISRAFDY